MERHIGGVPSLVETKMSKLRNRNSQYTGRGANRDHSPPEDVKLGEEMEKGMILLIQHQLQRHVFVHDLTSDPTVATFQFDDCMKKAHVFRQHSTRPEQR
jgi:hypothetical protein